MRTRAIMFALLVLAAEWLASVACWAKPLPQEIAAESEGSSSSSSKEQPGKSREAERIKKDADSEFMVNRPHSWRNLRDDFLLDQKQIWTSPSRLRLSDADWLLPVGGLTAGFLITDRDYSKTLSQNPTTISHYKTLSTAGVAALVGGAGSMWLLGHVRHDDHWSETGFLAGESALNSLLAVEAMKYSLRRQRPFQGDGSGPFFQNSGTSFPSEHAAMAWSVAGVIAHEYPGTFTKILVYSLASMVDISRVRGRQHFPSDVLVGSLIGNLVSQDIYSRHHDPELGGSEWTSIRKIFRADGNLTPANMGSPYVPLDSWIYPAFDRLAGLGVIESGFAGMKPWTRSECARLLSEAAEHVDGQGAGAIEAEQLYRLLENEFRDERGDSDGNNPLRGRVESVYSRFTAISGEPLTDGNHFGQTIINDYGRPYQEGFNSVLGFSGWMTSGRWVGYLRAEYQHSPSAPAQTDSARQFISSVDNVLPPPTPYSAENKVQLLDAYVGLNFQNWQVSLGRQSLWWGPTQGGPMMFSDNAAPVNMFRINRISPFKLPSVLGWLGPIRMEWFLGQFAGHQFVFRTDTGVIGQFGQSIGRQPFLQGQKFSLKPTPNFEFSVSFTVVFAGGPTPLTFHTLERSYTGLPNSQSQGGINDEGDGRSGVDFSYRVPGLRKWLTFYGDAFTEDEISPLSFPRKSAIRGGLYMPRIPGISKLDLRLEGGTTVPPDFPTCIGCFYVNHAYPDGSYINDGNLIGSWLGRAGQGEQAWSTYWLSSRNKIQFNYRHQKVSSQYLPQGGTLNDGGVKADFWLSSTVAVSASLQYEKWNYPLLAPLAKSNVATSLGITFSPHQWK